MTTKFDIGQKVYFKYGSVFDVSVINEIKIDPRGTLYFVEDYSFGMAENEVFQDIASLKKVELDILEQKLKTLA